MDDPIRVTVWGEYLHEKKNEKVAEIYPDGMHNAIADGITENLGDRVSVRTATLEEPEHGLTDEVLESTDVITWWGHLGHQLVSDEVADKVVDHVLQGMGFIGLHSCHYSKPFKRLMGTTCGLLWREANEEELIWTVNPSHPIADGVPHPIVVPSQEMYGEHFDIPPPDELVFISSFTAGEVFRSGCCFTRGRGRIFYFSPGHETHPVFFQPEIRKVISNAVVWARGHTRTTKRYPAARVGKRWFEDGGGK